MGSPWTRRGGGPETHVEGLARWRADAESAIQSKVAELAGRLGSPVGGVTHVGGATFELGLQAGRIVWHPETGAHEIHGDILEHYVRLGGPAGWLGTPHTDEAATPDGDGRYNHFQHGSIYWYPGIGAHEVHGAIRDKWAAHGWERYGYPTTDETSTRDGVGRFSRFRRVDIGEERSIYWHPDIGAHEVQGLIHARWQELGAETGYLGYPVGDEQAWTDPETGKPGRFSPFQRGNIVWSSGDVVRAQPQELTLRADLEAETVRGWAEVAFRSDGWIRFRGHLHENGTLSHHYVALFVVKRVGELGLDVVLSHIGGVHGTLGIGSRNDDWDQSGEWPQATRSWTEISSGPNYIASLQVSTGIMQIADALAAVGLGEPAISAARYVLIQM